MYIPNKVFHLILQTNIQLKCFKYNVNHKYSLSYDLRY